MQSGPKVKALSLHYCPSPAQGASGLNPQHCLAGSCARLPSSCTSWSLPLPGWEMVPGRWSLSIHSSSSHAPLRAEVTPGAGEGSPGSGLPGCQCFPSWGGFSAPALLALCYVSGEKEKGKTPQKQKQLVKEANSAIRSPLKLRGEPEPVFQLDAETE